MISALIVIAFVVMLLCGVPLFAVIGSVTALCLAVGDYQQTIMAQQMFSMADRTSLLAIPLFIVTSTLMAKGSSARRLVDFIHALVGWLPGGLSIATLTACLIFAALAGLSPAAIIAVGTMMYPTLITGGYDERFSLGFVTSAGSLGILVPPSIVVVIFGVVGEVNIEALFIAGVTPIVLIAMMFVTYSFIVGRKNKVKRMRFRPARILRKLYSGFWAIMLPVGVGGGIYSGLVTVTQAAALGAVYAFIIEFVFYRSLKPRDLPGLMRNSGSMIGMLLIIIAVTFGFNWYLTVESVPDILTEWIVAHFDSPIAFLLAVNILLLFLGCIMDILSAIFITVPLMLPAAVAMGIDPIHFGIVFIINFEIGYLTPPVGINLFTSGAVFKKPVIEVARSVIPFLGLLLIALALVTYYPPISLWLVKLTGNM
ncbi:MAG TPA: TRAP transporter large permease subunit [bacterium]|nr:TRAP transporter large permease subunit [bacterium]